LAVLSAASTAWFSLVEAPPLADAFHGADKVEHAVAYFFTVLCSLLAAVWRPGRGPGRYPRSWLTIVVGAVVVAIGIELVQGMTATRHRDWGDVIAGTTGTLGAFVVWAILRLRPSGAEPTEP
jgi:VanZ family protein